MEPLDDGGYVVGVVGGGDEADDVLGLGQEGGYLLHDGLHAYEARGLCVGAYLMVLAVDALEVAVREKDIADALLAADGRLFAAMDANSGSLGHKARMAKAKTLSAVGGAIARTDGAFHDAKIQLFCVVLKKCVKVHCHPLWFWGIQ